MKKLVIFDCDGVLVDSEFVANKVFSEILSQYGYFISFEECIRRFTGVDEHSCRKIIMEESGLDIPEDYWAKSQPTLLKAFEMELRPLLKSLLEILDRLNIARCVASNSSKHHVSHCLTLTNQSKFFNQNAIFTSQQVSRPKPAPDLFLFAAKEMGVKPENCVVVEDSSAGASAAIAAGMEVMMFLGGSHVTDQIWVDPNLRNRGVGKKLMEIVHEYGKKHSCMLSTVTTMDFQAPNFYAKLGYTIDFSKEGYSKDASCIFMSKKL